MTGETLDLDRATARRTPDGAVELDDPGYPLVLTLAVHRHGGRLQLARLTVQARHPAARITAGALGRLPLAQALYVAGAQVAAGGGAWPNEAFYRALARPKPPGQRNWDAGHWERVLTVWQWAAETGRPGGGAQAVADLWGVARDPTAWRWLAEARRRNAVAPAG